MRIDRRGFTTGLLAASALAGTSRIATAQAQELVFASFGGAYQDGIRKAWIEPFTKATGIRVREDTNPQIARIKAMVDTNTVTWDVVTGGGTSLMQGVDAGLFEPQHIDTAQEGIACPAGQHGRLAGK